MLETGIPYKPFGESTEGKKTVKILLDGSYGAKIKHAADRLKLTLMKSHGDVQVIESGAADIIAGTPDKSVLIGEKLRVAPVELDASAESLAIWSDGSVLYLCGWDEQGLVYALLEIAEQIDTGSAVEDLSVDFSESPATRFRGLFIFLHNKDCEAGWFYSREYWDSYFDLLSSSRYNSFNIIMAHQTNYLAPPFPFFIEVEEHPEVSVPGLSGEERRKNLAMLNVIGELAADHGLEFFLGIWEVIAWNFKFGALSMTQQSMVQGLTNDNLADYTYRVTKKLLGECPSIKGIQLRVNPESGIAPDQQTHFFANTIFRAMAEADHDVLLDLRGWGANPQTMQAAIDLVSRTINSLNLFAKCIMFTVWRDRYQYWI